MGLGRFDPAKLAFWRRPAKSTGNEIVDVEAQLDVETKGCDDQVEGTPCASTPTLTFSPSSDTATNPPASASPTSPASARSSNPTLAVVTAGQQPSAEKSPRAVHFKEETAPPAYESVVTRVSREADRDQPPCTPISIQGADQHGQPPTILVLFKEDYDWARAYLKDLDYKVALRRALRRHLYKWYALLIIAVTLAVLVSSKHTTIVDFLQPVTRTIRRWPGGWLIPIALLIVVSFPPLVGHEIIGILCGLVWGLGEGFGILAAGTFLGELAVWIVFKWMCTARAAKIEKRNKLYASLTQLIRDKSFTFVLILRFSAIPGHIVTAVSASAGANFWSYAAAAFLTLPKQLVLVYLGTSFGTHNKKDTAVSWVATAATFAGTVVAAVYIYYQMRIVIRRGGASRLPVGDPRVSGTAGGSEWADVEVHGADGVGAGVRLEMEEAGLGRRSVDVILGPHARAAQQQHRLARANGRSPLVRTRSLPGPITEDEMRTWLTQIDTALLTTTAHPSVVALDEKKGMVSDDDLAAAGAASSRADLGDLEPMPYASTVLLPPAVTMTPASPPARTSALPQLAAEHVYAYPNANTSTSATLAPPNGSASPTPSSRASASRPVSGTIPAILLTPTYTPARSRADSLRGTVSLDIERPRFGNEIAEEGGESATANAAAAGKSRSRGDSSAAWLGRPRN